MATVLDNALKTVVDKVNKALHNVKLPTVETEVSVDKKTWVVMAGLGVLLLFGLSKIFSRPKRRYYR